VHVDRAFAKHWSVDNADELVGLDLATLCEDAPAIVKQAIENKHWQGWLRGRRSDGSLFTAHAFAVAIPDDAQAGAQRVCLSLLAQEADPSGIQMQRDGYRSMFEAMFRVMPEPSYILDRNGTIIQANPAANKLANMPEGGMVGRNIKDLDDAESAAKTDERIAQCLLGDPLQFEVKYDLPSGQSVPIEVFTVAFDFCGERQMVAVERNMTATRKTEQIIRKSAERPGLALASANQGFYDLNVQTGESVVSDEYATMLGYDPATFVENNAAWIDRLHPDDREPVAQNYLDCVSGKIKDYRVEFRQRMADGRWKWILSVGKIIALDEQGAPLRFVGTHTDISDIKAAQEIIQRNAERPHLALSSAKQGFFDCNLQTGETYVSQTFAGMLGYAPSEMRDMHSAWTDRLHPEDLEAAEARVEDFLAGRAANYQSEFRMGTRDGRWVWILSIGNIIEHDEQGEPLRMVGTHTDITEMKAAQEELDARQHHLMQLGRVSLANGLASVVAHELNQPLCALVNHTASINLALQSDVFEIQALRDDARHASDAAHRAAGIIKRFRQLFAKDKSQTKECSLQEIISQSLDLIRGDLQHARVKITKDYDKDIPAITADPTLIQLVVLNLVQNAIQAMEQVPQSRRKLLLNLEKSEQEDTVHLTITDTGPGFSPGVIRTLFDANGSTKADGLGMGLCICRLIVRAHGGDIRLLKTDDSGSTLLIRLPTHVANTPTLPVLL